MSEQTQQTKMGVLVELDCLLDTRLATLYEIHPSLVEKALAAGYFTRDQDVFPLVSKEDFSMFYAKRSKKTLSLAMPTKCMAFIRELGKKLTVQAIETPYHNGAKIIVNTYPYKLTDHEAKQLIGVVVTNTAGFVDVQIVNWSPEVISPAYCRASLGGLIMYDSSAWLDAHAKSGAFKHTQIPDVSLFMPAIYFGQKPEEGVVEQETGRRLTGFQAWAISASPIIDANIINTDVFCANPELLKPKETAT